MKKTFLTIFILAHAALGASSGSRRSPAPLAAMFRHRVHEAHAQATRAMRSESAESIDAVLPDSGQIAIIDDSDGVVTSTFNLDHKTLEFKPADANATRYTYDVADSRFDSSVVSSSTKLSLSDDDSKEVGLPFLFPFFGFRYSTAFIGSDGQISFGSRDDSQWQTVEDPGVRMVVGPPRLAPLYNDLDASQSGAAVSYLSSASRFVVTWQNIPIFGPGSPRQTFQAAMFPDGRVEFSYNGVNVATVPGVAVGIAQGGDFNLNRYALVDYSAPSSFAFPATIVEEFLNTPSFDVALAVAKFYRSHDDAYDFLVLYDTVDRTATLGGCAFSIPVHNWVHGIGVIASSTFPVEEFDFSPTVGAAGRFQQLLYMGPLGQYPANPTQALASSSPCGAGNALSLLGEEAGHRFLPYLEFKDPATGQPSVDLLNSDGLHWGFYFNSDASLLGGNRILDHGAGTSPRFETQQALQHYSALDQYAMGLRAPADVAPTFLVRNSSIASDFSPDHLPQPGELFDGTRLDITVDSIAAAMGPRAPDASVSPKRFRFGFVLIVPAGTTPSQSDLSKLDAIRTAWQSYFSTATDGRGQADTGIAKQVRLSVWPAAGIIQGHTINAAIVLGSQAAAPVTIALSASGSAIGVPTSVTVPAGSQSATFTITGNSPGTVQLTAQGPDATYETSTAYLSVKADATALTLERVSAGLLALGLVVPVVSQTGSGALGPKLDEDLAFRIRDDNYLPYPGLQLTTSATGSGGTKPSSPVTNALGFARLTWMLDTKPGPNTLTLGLADQPSITTKVTAIAVLEPGHLRDLR